LRQMAATIFDRGQYKNIGILIRHLVIGQVAL
jgi:hypothetical protein